MSFPPRLGNIYRFAVLGISVDSMGGLQPWRRLLRWGAGIAVAALVSSGGALARDTTPPFAAAPVELASLPVEARVVHGRILAGGPFRYAKDGIVFANRERRLPAEPRGFYREYTVATPGAGDRGARRIVCGGRAPSAPSACWYSDDHYTSFRRIAS